MNPEEIDTGGPFTIPPRPTPRERYTTRVQERKRPNTWTTVHVEVLDGDRIVARYDRNYAMLRTFEPFGRATGCSRWCPRTTRRRPCWTSAPARSSRPRLRTRPGSARFGYLSLATHPKLEPREFIRCTSFEGARQVRFAVEQSYYLTTGTLIPEKDW